MKQSDLNKIYKMTESNRQSFKKNYPTAKSLADAIQQVFLTAALQQIIVQIISHRYNLSLEK